MDLDQQVHQTARSLHPVSDRFFVLTLVHPVRLFSWLYQALRDADPECGEFNNVHGPAERLGPAANQASWY